MLLQKWDVFFRLNVIKEAKRLTLTPELLRLVQTAESPPGGVPSLFLFLFIQSLRPRNGVPVVADTSPSTITGWTEVSKSQCK